MNFIESFLEYTAAYESPTDFFYWSAIAGLAAILRDNCYLLLGDTKLFPNVYVLIVANPAMRKAKPLNSVIELVKVIDSTKVIEGRTSIQAIIQRLSELEKTKSGKSISGASGIIFSEELSAMLTEDDANIPVLTDLYDYKSSYTSSLISRGTTRLNNVVVSLLGASNEELLKPVFNNRAIYGGLLSRCLVVYGDKVRHRNSLMWEDPKKYNPSALRQCLQEIAQLRGLFRITEEGKVFYDDWYRNVCPTLEKKANRTGAEGRIHTNVLKLAMIMSVSERQSLEIDIDTIERAIEKCQSLFVNYRRITLGQGRSKDSDNKTLMLKLLWETGAEKEYQLSRRDLITKTWGDMSSEELDSIERNLLEGGFIQITEAKGGLKHYKLTPFSIKYFTDNFKV